MDETPTTEPLPVRSHWPISILAGITSLFNLLLPLFLVRILTPEEIGVFKVFFLYIMLAPAISFTAGIMSGLPYWAGQNEKRLPALQSSAASILMLGFLFLCVSFFLQHQLASFFDWQPIYALIFPFALFTAITGKFFEESAIATGKIWTGALFHAGFELLRTAFILGAAFYLQTLTAVFVAHTVVMCFKVLVSLVFGYQLRFVRFAISSRTLKEIWRYGFPVSLAWMFGIFVTHADQLILSAYISPKEFAFYTIGCLAIPPLYILENSVTRVLIPQLSEAFANGASRQAAELYKRAVQQLSYLLTPATVGLVVFAEPIIELLFTAEYLRAAGYLRLFALSYLFFIIPFDSVARARGHASWILKNFLFFSCLSLSLAFTATKYIGPYGALSSVLVTKLIMHLYVVIYIHRETRWNVRDFIPFAALSQHALVSLLLAGLSIGVRESFSNDFYWFLTCGSLFFLAYFPLTLLVNNLFRQRSEKPRVLMVVTHLVVGGLEKMVLDLCRRLQREGSAEVVVYVYDHLGESSGNSLLTSFQKEGIQVITSKKPPRFSPFVVYSLLKIIVTQRIEIVHAHNLGSLIYATFAKILSLGRVRVLYTQHTLLHLSENPRYATYEKLFTRFADVLTVVSEELCDGYRKLGVADQKLQVVENGIRFSEQLIGDRNTKRARRALLEELPLEQRERLGDFHECNWILCMARLHPKKGQECALELWNHLSVEERRSAVLLLVGPEAESGMRERVLGRIETLPDRERVLLLGATDKPQSWLQSSDLFLSCSEFEGMPLGPLEAVGCGLPSVLSDIPGHRILEGACEFFPLGDPQAGANAISICLKGVAQPELHRSTASAAGWVRSRFSMERMVGHYVTLYQRLLTFQRRPSIALW